VQGGRAGPRPIEATRVVGVLPVGHRVESVGAHDVVGDLGEQFVAAMEAAVRAVAPVLLALALVGVQLEQFRTDDGSDLVGRCRHRW